MAKEHKASRKKGSTKLHANVKWGLIIAVVLVFVVFNIFGTKTLLKDILSKLRPTPTPILPKIINISPPAELNTDQVYYVKLAVEALSARLDMKSEDIKIVSVKEKQWSDSSLGCPQKGVLYIQSITPGYVIELSAKGRTYFYNGGLNRVVSC